MLKPVARATWLNVSFRETRSERMVCPTEFATARFYQSGKSFDKFGNTC